MNDRAESKMMRTIARLARALAFAGCLGWFPAAVGCGGGVEEPEIADGSYAGPALSVDSSGRSHVVVMEAPTPGWAITLDRALEVHEHRQAFVTVTRPNPAVVHAQVVVKQNLLTSVDSRYPVRVYARVVDYQSPSTEGEYKLAASAEARVGPLPTLKAPPKPEPGAKPEPGIGPDPADLREATPTEPPPSSESPPK